jgi:hypothetical protein
MERLRVVVTDDGMTAVFADASANVVTCAVDWKDLAAFKARCGPGVQQGWQLHGCS